MQDPKSYQFVLKLFTLEIINLNFSTTADGNRYLNTGIVLTFAVIVLLGAYGEKLVNLYRALV